MFRWFRRKSSPDDQLLSSNQVRSDALPVSRPAVSEGPPYTMEVAPASPSGNHPHHSTLDPRKLLHGIERVGLGLRDMAMLYWNDIFHTMLTMPSGRFLAIFFVMYVMEYLCFAVLYLTVSDCIVGANTFSLALWFSVRTATTIGYSTELQPNVNCTSINLLMTFQVISAALIDYCMMGLVFARFATPSARASTVKFSSTMALYQQENGTWALCFRLANVRKQSLLRPEASLFLVSPDSQGASFLQFEAMHLADQKSAMANLRLGVPTLVTHVITPDSPLFDSSIDLMQQRGLELLVLLDAIDPMTSNNVGAHWSYAPHDLRINRRFGTLNMRDRRGNTKLNFGEFDNTIPSVMYPDLDLDVVALSHRTIRSLTPMALNPNVAVDSRATGSGGSTCLVTLTNGTPVGTVRGNEDLQEASSVLLDHERQLSALCEAVIRDPTAGPELRHLAISASFRKPRRASDMVSASMTAASGAPSLSRLSPLGLDTLQSYGSSTSRTAAGPSEPGSMSELQLHAESGSAVTGVTQARWRSSGGG